MNSLLKKYSWIIIFLILLYGLFLRIYDLSLDPPMTTGTFSQDLTTDPYHITSFAANKIKFGEWELFEYPKWQVFKVSLPSLMAYILYSLGEVNIFWTHLAGVILGYAGILLLIWSIFRNLAPSNRLTILTVAVFLAANFILVTYTRMPFLETGVILCFGLTLMLLRRDGVSSLNLLIIGAIISIACLCGRIFSITIGLAIITTLLLSRDRAKFVKSGLLLAGIIISGAILLFVLYGGRIGAYYRYLAEHSETSGGNLYIILSFIDFVQVLFSYGTNNQLFRDSPFLFIAGYIAVVLAILLYRNYHRWFREQFLLRFGLWWAGWMFLFFFPFNYRPLRYSLLLYLPLVLIMASVMGAKDIKKNLCPQVPAVLSTILLFLVNYYFLSHLVIDFFFYPDFHEIQYTVYAWLLLPVIILTALMVLPLMQQTLSRVVARVGPIIAVLAGLSLVFQTYLYFQWINHSHHTTETAAYDMATSISEDAVFAGPYAPRLTLSSNIRSMIYYFGLERPDVSIFDIYPITHITADKSHLQAAVDDFPELEGTMIITDQLIRGRAVLLISLKDSAAEYNSTDYEKAERFLNTGVLDSALIYNRRFMAHQPDNIPALKQSYHILADMENYSACEAVLDELYFRHPNNADATYYCFTYYKILGHYFNRPDLISRAEQCRDKAKWLYLGKEESVQRSYDQIR